MTICCGTGHRPKDLPCKYNEKHSWAIARKNALFDFLSNNQIELVISGMAIGWDQWLAESALKLKIPLHCYIPFEGQEKRWPTYSQSRYKSILSKADKAVYLYNGYSNQAFLDRNKAMVDNSDLVLALWNPQRKEGGTFHCINYAKQKNKKIVNIWE